MTPIVENSSNPTFDHTAQLRLLDPSAWGRVCGPSAALVFRVWHRARCSWWDAPQLSSSDRAEPPPDCAVGERITAASGSRFGDKLIGSAVVGLEVLRGAIGAREGLRLIDGWYHVLDDLQRPQGQIKVSRDKCRVCLVEEHVGSEVVRALFAGIAHQMAPIWTTGCVELGLDSTSSGGQGRCTSHTCHVVATV